MEVMGHDSLTWFNDADTVPPREESVAVRPQLPARHDHLRRLERDPEEHHRQADPRPPRDLREDAMNFDLTDDQKLLVDTVATFAKKESPVERLRAIRENPIGWDKDVWKQMGELGWLGVPFPEVARRHRRHLRRRGARHREARHDARARAVRPVGRRRGPHAVRTRHARSRSSSCLPPIIEGETSLALAYAEQDSRYDVADVETRADEVRRRLPAHRREGVRPQRPRRRPHRRLRAHVRRRRGREGRLALRRRSRTRRA